MLLLRYVPETKENLRGEKESLGLMVLKMQSSASWLQVTWSVVRQTVMEEGVGELRLANQEKKGGARGKMAFKGIPASPLTRPTSYYAQRLCQIMNPPLSKSINEATALVVQSFLSVHSTS